jgi:hypothetical protein
VYRETRSIIEFDTMCGGLGVVFSLDGGGSDYCIRPSPNAQFIAMEALDKSHFLCKDV